MVVASLYCFFKENDIILTETDTSGYGVFETRFGKHTIGISQSLWGSIGFAFVVLRLEHRWVQLWRRKSWAIKGRFTGEGTSFVTENRSIL